jgi:sulfite reductase (ferredoxin)
LDRANLDLQDAADFRLHINGCPNSCGRHPIGSIALFGAARRVDDRLVPHYVLQLGGRVGEGRTRLAKGNEVLPARNVPAFLVEFLRAFRGSAQYPDFDAFLDAGGREAAGRIAARHKHVPPFAVDKNYYYDWGAEEPFSMAGRGPGECSAGVFDLITVDLASARQALEEGRLFSATHLAARALLITRGEEARDAADALRLFEEHFLDAGLVDGSFRSLITGARQRAASPGEDGGFEADRVALSALVAAVENLYENMDQSLRFQPAPQQCGQTQAHPAETKPGVGEDVTIDREADFRGVTCPLNYVKTKLLLGQMERGQVLSVLLDDAGGRSVPQSAEKDGHEVLSVQKQGDRWRVIIRKG